MRRSQRIDLAIHALWYMAYKAPEGMVMVRDVAARQGISESYLAKIFQNLAKTDIVTSVRGKNGGYRLGRASEEISVGDIVRALDGELNGSGRNCTSRGCGYSSRDCFLPAIFNEARKRMFSALDAVTLGDLATQIRHRDVPVSWVEKN